MTAFAELDAQNRILLPGDFENISTGLGKRFRGLGKHFTRGVALNT
jgi:hypothetical protein